MNNVFSYTGKEFPKEREFYDFFGYVNGVDVFTDYIENHVVVIGGNLRRVFSKCAGRKHGIPVAKQYESAVSYLLKNEIIVEDEMQYRITRKGSKSLRNYLVSGDLFVILKNLQEMHDSDKDSNNAFGIPLKGISHFELLNEVDIDTSYYRERADVFSSDLKKLANYKLIEIIIPSNNKVMKDWLNWFKDYAKVESKNL